MRAQKVEFTCVWVVLPLVLFDYQMLLHNRRIMKSRKFRVGARDTRSS